MRRDRFTMMLKFLHINDNSMYKKKGEPGHDSLFKIRPFLEQLFHNFQAAYTLHREISVDETMISYKGRIGFIQYMPKKPKKWGLKAFALSDSHSGYVYNWHLYTGKFSMLCVCECVWESVLPLPHLNRKRWQHWEHGQWHDSCSGYETCWFTEEQGPPRLHRYTSPALFADLRSKGFGACGTLRMNRRGIPPAIKPTIEKGTTKVVNVDDSMLVIKWSDKREVTVLTTIHQAGFVGVERRNRHAPGGRWKADRTIISMGGVDRVWSAVVNRTEQSAFTTSPFAKLGRCQLYTLVNRISCFLMYWWTLFSPYSWSWSHPQISLGVVYMLPESCGRVARETVWFWIVSHDPVLPSFCTSSCHWCEGTSTSWWTDRVSSPVRSHYT